MEPQPTGSSERSAWVIMLAGAAILMVTMGARQSLGLFISPLKSSTGLGIATISLGVCHRATDVGRHPAGLRCSGGSLWSRENPYRGPSRAGTIGMALTPFMTSSYGLIVSLGVLSAIGSGAGSFSVLIGAAARHLTSDKRGKAAGIINAGGSVGAIRFRSGRTNADPDARMDGCDCGRSR